MTGLSWRGGGMVVACGALILALSLGIRHGFGLFLQPMSADLGWGREVFALAIAVQNLVWGLAQPVTGMLADRWGAGRAIFVGALFYAAGLTVMALSVSAVGLVGAGMLIGLGLSGTSFAVVFGAVGRVVTPERRSAAFGIVAAIGSFGQFAMVPGTLGLISHFGWSGALLALACLATVMAPLAVALGSGVRTGNRRADGGEADGGGADGKAGGGPAPAHGPAAGQALREALGHRDFGLLAFGFFVCGFQVVFIGTHLPAFLMDRGLSLEVATTVLALIGLFNVFGTWLAGHWGGRWSKPKLLSAIYLSRGLVIALFAFLPVTQVSAYAFGVAIGLLWLSTVPLTNGTVAVLFGVRNLSMLAGLVFLAHQIGAFLGGWLGGLIYDRTGSYDAVWLLAIALSLIAALVNLPIQETPLLRPAPAEPPP